jgi:hypothetical protein
MLSQVFDNKNIQGVFSNIQGGVTLFISSTQKSKRHLSQSLWWLCGEIEGLSTIPCSFRHLRWSNKYECKTSSDVTYWTPDVVYYTQQEVNTVWLQHSKWGGENSLSQSLYNENTQCTISTAMPG